MVALRKWSGVVGLLLAALLFCAAFGIFRWGTAEVVVVAPADEALVVTLPGAAPTTVSAGTHQVFRVARGHQLIVLARGGDSLNYALDIEHPFLRWALPAHGQCLVLREGSSRRIALRVAGGVASLIEGQTWYADDAPPPDVRDTFFTLLDAPCDP